MPVIAWNQPHLNPLLASLPFPHPHPHLLPRSSPRFFRRHGVVGPSCAQLNFVPEASAAAVTATVQPIDRWAGISASYLAPSVDALPPLACQRTFLVPLPDIFQICFCLPTTASRIFHPRPLTKWLTEPASHLNRLCSLLFHAHDPFGLHLSHSNNFVAPFAQWSCLVNPYCAHAHTRIVWHPPRHRCV